MPPLSPAIDRLPFYCPIPPAPQPRPETLDTDSVRWMVDYGICTPDSWLAKINSGHVAATMVPLAEAATPAQHMSLFSDFCYWAYAWDDARDARLDLRPPPHSPRTASASTGSSTTPDRPRTRATPTASPCGTCAAASPTSPTPTRPCASPRECAASSTAATTGPACSAAVASRP